MKELIVDSKVISGISLKTFGTIIAITGSLIAVGVTFSDKVSRAEMLYAQVQLRNEMRLEVDQKDLALREKMERNQQDIKALYDLTLQILQEHRK